MPLNSKSAHTVEDYEVIVLYEGYSRFEDKKFITNCSCTLIKGPTNIIVDTMTAWDGERIESALKKHGLQCSDIQYVICTHGHNDHIGCNYLFREAKLHIVGFCISNRDAYDLHDFHSGKEFVINDKIKVIPTPGHTLQDVSVIVTTSNGTVAITGDLFEKEEDLEDDTIWQQVHSDSKELQVLNRHKILSLADWIVPGHGPMFEVPQP